MCTVSGVIDHTRERFAPWTFPNSWPPPNQAPPAKYELVPVTQAQFNALKAELAEIRELLIAAKAIDKKLGLADCEGADKVEFIKALAKLLDVDLSDVLP